MYKEKLLLPTAPRAARGSDVDESKIPSNPPYTAYIANLPYDIDNDDVEKFFQGLSVRFNVELVQSTVGNTCSTLDTGQIGTAAQRRRRWRPVAWIWLCGI